MVENSFTNTNQETGNRLASRGDCVFSHPCTVYNPGAEYGIFYSIPGSSKSMMSREHPPSSRIQQQASVLPGQLLKTQLLWVNQDVGCRPPGSAVGNVLQQDFKSRTTYKYKKKSYFSLKLDQGSSCASPLNPRSMIVSLRWCFPAQSSKKWRCWDISGIPQPQYGKPRHHQSIFYDCTGRYFNKQSSLKKT